MLNFLAKLLLFGALGAGAAGVSSYYLVPVDNQQPSCDTYCRQQCSGQDKSCWNECRASGACT
ncbi:MAG TPA: hypothetical protein VER08_07240 [Pyrinomonadaceae bacterium]|nr:hypothetical protein [Pyrinomonadaceae bacterium]